MSNKLQSTYDELLKKLKDALEENFIAVVSGCFFHLSQNIYRQIQSKGLTALYLEDEEFAIKMKMLVSLAFVPEHDVIDCFTILMGDFPESGKEIAEYFEANYIGKRIVDQSRRIPPIPIRIWNMFTRVRTRLLRTNNSIEEWHNAFQSGITCSHPSFIKLLMHLQREQSLQEAKLVRWETGEMPKTSKQSESRNLRLLTLVEEYNNRKILTYLRGIAYNFDF